MADNIDVKPSDEQGKVPVKTDEISAIHWPCYKIAYGADGEVIASGYVKAGGALGAVRPDINTANRLGAAIDGTPDEIWLCVVPLAVNADIYGGMSWKDVS